MHPFIGKISRLARVRRVPRRIINALSKPVEISENPYATHLPVLIGLSWMLNVRRVLEFGCGSYSTATFLNREIFPQVVWVQSFDNDAEWLNKIAATNKDSRLHLSFVDGAMSKVVSEINFTDFDLLFVDDSLTVAERAQTISMISNNYSPSNVVLIHDYEVKEYQKAARVFRHRFGFDAFNPQTGVMWGNHSLDKRKLKKLNAILKLYSRKIPPDDLNRWLEILVANEQKFQ